MDGISKELERYRRTAVGVVFPVFDRERSHFGHKAGIRTGRTTTRWIWMGPFRDTKEEAIGDLRESRYYAMCEDLTTPRSNPDGE